MLFSDRIEAGRRLGEALAERLADIPFDRLVLGIPRGGVIVAREVARVLEAPLDIVVTRKIGAPQNAELGIGAVTEDGRAILDEGLVTRLRVNPDYIEAETARQVAEIARRVAAYRAGRPPIDPKGRCCIVVDDGLATGGTARSALAWVRAKDAAVSVLAVPVASDVGLMIAGKDADVVVCLEAPAGFAAVGQFYDRFDQVSDAEVVAALGED
jgi:putative phosphoribosyl transferase